MGSRSQTTTMKLFLILVTLTGAICSNVQSGLETAENPEFRFLFKTITRVSTLTKTAVTTSTSKPVCLKKDYTTLAVCLAKRKKRSPRDLYASTPIYTADGKPIDIDQILPSRAARAEVPESEVDASSFGEVEVVAKGLANLDHQRLNLFKVYATSTKTVTSTQTVLKNGATTMTISLEGCRNADYISKASLDLNLCPYIIIAN